MNTYRKKKTCVWIDQSRGWGENRVITGSEINIKEYGCRLSIHRHVHYEPDIWLATGLDLNMHQLESKDLEEAKKEALSIARKNAVELLSLIDSVESPNASDKES